MTQAFNLSQLANNLNTSGKLDATDGLTGAVPVANGGTGQSSLTANAVVLGNGTSGVTTVAPSTSGNVLVSNGTTWVSQAPSGGGVTSLNGQTGAITNTDFQAIGSYAVLMNVVNSSLSLGSTIAGSSLRYNAVNSASVTSQAPARFVGRTNTVDNATYNGGGTACSGTWRKMCNSTTYAQYGYKSGSTARDWTYALYIRIS
jgi:hypothetical protein